MEHSWGPLINAQCDCRPGLSVGLGEWSGGAIVIVFVPFPTPAENCNCALSTLCYSGRTPVCRIQKELAEITLDPPCNCRSVRSLDRPSHPPPTPGKTTSCPYGHRAGFVLWQESCSSFRLSAVGGASHPCDACPQCGLQASPGECERPAYAGLNAAPPSKSPIIPLPRLPASLACGLAQHPPGPSLHTLTLHGETLSINQSINQSTRRVFLFGR